ncbi:MAG: DMT family transporter [Bacteroidales bacterium]
MKLLAVFACILWGSAFAGAKIGFTFMPPVLLSGMRFSLAGMLLVPFLLHKKVEIRKTIAANWRFMLLFAFTQTFMQYGLFFMGLNKVPAATAAIIIGAGPLFVAIMAHLTMHDDKMNFKKMVAILLGIFGVIFISLNKGGLTSDNPQFYLGVFLLLTSNLVGGYTNIMVVKHQKPISPILLTSFANFTGGVMLLITGLFLEKLPQQTLPFEFYAALIWLAIIPAAGFSIWYTLLQKPGVKVSELNIWKFIIPVTGCILSWIILPDEKPDMESIIGILSITLALQVFQMPENIWNKILRFVGIKI